MEATIASGSKSFDAIGIFHIGNVIAVYKDTIYKEGTYKVTATVSLNVVLYPLYSPTER